MDLLDIDISAEEMTIPEPRPRAPRGPERAGAPRRLVAFAVDAAVLALIVSAHAALALQSTRYPFDTLRAQGWLFLSLAAVLAVAYSWFFVALAARTPGMALAGLRLQTLQGASPNPSQAFARALLCLLSAVGLFGFALALFDARGQTLHDKLCRCVAIID